MSHTLIASVASAQFKACFEMMSRWKPFLTSPLPTSVWVGMDEIAENQRADWAALLLHSSTRSTAQWFGQDERLVQGINITPGSQISTCTYPDAFAELKEAVRLIEPLPFELCSFGSIFFYQWLTAEYPRWGFGRSHVDHGWGCAFRGAGHDRLVSRRWLDFGPWQTIRRPNDTTFIQFHDLAITDPAEAYEQAKIGHQRMGIDPIGGYIQGIDLDVIATVRGLYLPGERTLEIVVGPGNSVRQQDMRVACGLRLHHRLTKPTTDRVDHVAYVFMAREDAQAHLHELWLRELQCWYVDERGKHRLDADHHPTPQPPAWVARLGSSSSNDI